MTTTITARGQRVSRGIVHVRRVAVAFPRKNQTMPSETKTSKRAAKSATNGETNKPVLVTTEFRGVFYGRLEHYDADKQTAILTDARCAIQWRTTGGFLELAERGPNSNSKIGSKAPRIHLNKVTSIAECTPAAITAWENA